MFHLVNLEGNKMDLEEVYLRQIVEQLKLQNKLKEDSNELLKAISILIRRRCNRKEWY